MKYINFKIINNHLTPTKHILHKGYVYDSNLIYHDIKHHGNNQDGSNYKELLAQGAATYDTNKFNEAIIYNIINNCEELPDMITTVPNKFKLIISIEKFINRYSIHYSNKPNLINFYNILALGYKQASKRVNYKLNHITTERICTYINRMNLKNNTLVKVPLVYLKESSFDLDNLTYDYKTKTVVKATV